MNDSFGSNFDLDCDGKRFLEPLLTYGQVAFLLQISPSKLKKDVRMGRGPASIKMGSLRRFRFCDIENYVEEQLLQAASEAARKREQKRFKRLYPR